MEFIVRNRTMPGSNPGSPANPHSSHLRLLPFHKCHYPAVDGSKSMFCFASSIISCLVASIIQYSPKITTHITTHAKQPTKDQKIQCELILSQLFSHKAKKAHHPIPGKNEETTTAGIPYNR